MRAMNIQKKRSGYVTLDFSLNHPNLSGNFLLTGCDFLEIFLDERPIPN
jgi:hypothetical protein